MGTEFYPLHMILIGCGTHPHSYIGTAESSESHGVHSSLVPYFYVFMALCLINPGTILLYPPELSFGQVK
jgi:hypothetical protein